MKNIFSIGTIILCSFPSLSAQIKNTVTKEFTVKSKCETAKTNIEKAGSIKKTAQVSYDTASQTAVLSYNKSKTTSSEILKRIALAGYDNSEYLAPDEAYDKLDEHCRYPREKQQYHTQMQHKQSNHAQHTENEATQEKHQLSGVFNAYFQIKDALVQTNSTDAAKEAAQLGKAVKAVPMNKLSHDVHNVWMDELNTLENLAKQISSEKNIEKQRKAFSKLSESLYKVAKIAKLDDQLYYQNCPMYNGGSNWLSKEKNIRNPFYGNQMLTCGSTVETLKK